MTITQDMINMVKESRHPRIPLTETAYDAEIERYLKDALNDLGFAGVVVPSQYEDYIGETAVIYAILRFGQPTDPDRLKATYDERKGQMSTATGFTDWGGIDG